MATLVYNVFQGLYYGVRSALYMDITTPRVAGGGAGTWPWSWSA